MWRGGEGGSSKSKDTYGCGKSPVMVSWEDPFSEWCCWLAKLPLAPLGFSEQFVSSEPKDIIHRECRALGANKEQG